MQYLKVYFSLSLFAIFFSCNTGNKKEGNTTNEQLIIETQTNSTKADTFLDLKTIYLKKNAYEIKSGFGITSGTLERSYFNYHLFDSVGIYGGYYLLNPDTLYDMPFVGELIIFTHERPWKASDKNEKFVELISYTPIIPLTEDIFVGQRKDKIIDILGEPQIESNNVLYYHDEFTHILALKIKHDTVNAFRFGYYERNVELDDIIQIIDANFNLRCL